MKKATSPFLNLRMVPQCLFRPCFLERVQMSPEVRCLKAAALVLNERPGSPKYDCRKDGKVWMVGMVGMVGMVSRFFHQGVGWSWPLERTCLNGSSYIHRLDMGHGTWFHGLKRVFLVDLMCSTWQDSRMFVTCHATSLRLWNVLRIRKEPLCPRVGVWCLGTMRTIFFAMICHALLSSLAFLATCKGNWKRFCCWSCSSGLGCGRFGWSTTTKAQLRKSSNATEFIELAIPAAPAALWLLPLLLPFFFLLLLFFLFFFFFLLLLLLWLWLLFILMLMLMLMLTLMLLAA